MATLDQAFIKAYTQARQSPAPTAADVAPLAHPRRVGSGALGLRSIGLTPRQPRESEPAVAPQTVVRVVAKLSAIEQPAPVTEQALPERIVVALSQATSAEAVSSEARRAALDFMPAEDSEPFAVSLATPLVPELILAESLAVEQTVYYCEPAGATRAPDQSNLLVWHPTTRDFIMSESEMVVVPRFSPQMQAESVSPTSNAMLDTRRSVAREFVAKGPLRLEQCEAPAEAPTNRAVVVPPPLPKTLIPPAPETSSPRLGDAREASGEIGNVAIIAAPTVDVATTDAAIAEAATIAPAIGKPAFAPLSTFSPRLVGEVLRPQLEVDRFAWPEVCGLLLGRVEADFIRLAVELTVRLSDTNQVVAWTGCQRGEGRTTSLLCMAQRMSALGQRCVLVDADFSRPELARRLGISAQVGWEEIVAGGAQLSDVLIGSIEDKIALLPRRQKCAAGTHPGAGPRAAALFGMLREAFDVVLLDVGPMAGDAELADMASCAAAANVGGAYLVFDSRNTSTGEMAATAESLRSGGIKVWGAIENFRR